MLVFPAFNDNYRTRKRSFISCTSCQLKRIKCDSFIDYQNHGCCNCQRYKLECLLIDKSDDAPRSILTPQPPSKDKQKPSSRAPSRITRSVARTTQTEMVSPLDDTNTIPDITADYLRRHHNFVCIGRALDCVALWLTLELLVKEDVPRRLPYDQFSMLLSIDAFTLLLTSSVFTATDICNLLELYMLKVNLVWPLLPAAEFWAHLARNEVPTILVYAMVLVIARDSMAEPILSPILGGDDYHQNLEKFMVSLENKTRQLLMAMPYLCFDFRFCKMVVLSMFLFHFGPHRFGNEQMLSDLSSAVSIAVGMEVHKKNTIIHVATAKREYVANLWWCLYVNDRINALINARSLFIRLDDFNLDLPYANLQLLKLVQLARLVENMMLAVFRPFDNNNVVLPINKMEIRYKMFDLDEFQKLEFDLCDKEQIANQAPYDNKITTLQDLRSWLPDYTSQHLHFIFRLLQNMVISIAQKVRYDDPQIPNLIPELYTFKACHNIAFYNRVMPPEIHIHLPITVFTLFYALCYLLLRRTYLKYLSPNDAIDIGLDFELTVESKFAWDEQMTILKNSYAGKWWFIAEYCRLALEFEKLFLLNHSDMVPSTFLAYDLSHFSYNMVFIALESDLYKLHESKSKLLPLMMTFE